MSLISCALAISLHVADLVTITGRVLDEGGQPLAGARVFFEAGHVSELEEAQAASDGSFSFEGVIPGLVQVVAIADGHSFGGVSIDVSATDAPKPVIIQLGQSASLDGTIEDPKGKPVQGAIVMRVALVDRKVSIPFAKLAAFGFKKPESDANGRFQIVNLPVGAAVTLKVGHPRFAQEAISGITVGQSGLRITMPEGVLINGEVFASKQSRAVANADVFFRNLDSLDTAISRSDSRGNFAIKLKPGRYLMQASSVEHRSVAWEPLTITGEQLTMKLRMNVLGLGIITGEVRDVRTQNPVEGATFVLEAGGSIADYAYTGASGRFEINAAEGPNILKLESAPGYPPPEKGVVQVTMVEGKSLELPVFLLSPLPSYRVEVVDGSSQPVAGAVVTILQPAQFGWYSTDASGAVKLAFSSMASGPQVIGLAEHAERAEGALFTFNANEVEVARVQLLPLARVAGQVLADGKRPVKGAQVGAFYADEHTPTPLLLWKTLTYEEGRFSWPCVAPQAPFRCVVSMGADESGESSSTILQDGASHDLGVIDVSRWSRGDSAMGDQLKWYDNKHLCGPNVDAAGARSSAYVLIYCPPNEATAAIEAATNAAGILGNRGVRFAVVVSARIECSSGSVPVYVGKSPSQATVFVLDRTGAVRLEAFGLPPLAAIQQALSTGA